MRGELKSDISGVKLEVKSVRSEIKSVQSEVKALESKMDAQFNKVDARFNKMDARFDKMDSKFEEISSTNHRMLAFIEEQSSNTKAAFEAYSSVYEAQKRIEVRTGELEKNQFDIARLLKNKSL